MSSECLLTHAVVYFPSTSHRRPMSRRFSLEDGGVTRQQLTISHFLKKHGENVPARGQRSVSERLPTPSVNTLPARAWSPLYQPGTKNASFLHVGSVKCSLKIRRKTQPNCRASVHTNGMKRWVNLSSGRESSRTASTWTAAEPHPQPACSGRAGTSRITGHLEMNPSRTYRMLSNNGCKYTIFTL